MSCEHIKPPLVIKDPEIARGYKIICSGCHKLWLPPDEMPTHGPAVRTADPKTSHAGAKDVNFRAETQKHRILKAYERGPLIADEAAVRSGTQRSCYWKRCSELREMGLIEPTGLQRRGFAGSEQMEC